MARARGNTRFSGGKWVFARRASVVAPASGFQSDSKSEGRRAERGASRIEQVWPRRERKSAATPRLADRTPQARAARPWLKLRLLDPAGSTVTPRPAAAFPRFRCFFVISKEEPPPIFSRLRRELIKKKRQIHRHKGLAHCSCPREFSRSA